MLTEDTKHHPSPEFYQQILNKINNIRYSPTKDFDKKRTSKSWRRRKRKIKEQKLKEPDSWHFHNRMKLTEDEKRMFYEVRYYNNLFKCYHTKFVFSEPWRFSLRIRPHWITHIERKDELLEQQKHEVCSVIDEYRNRGRLLKMRGGCSYAWKRVNEKKEEVKLYAYNSLKNYPLYKIMEGYKEEKQLWEYDLKN